MGLDMYIFKYPRVPGFAGNDYEKMVKIHEDCARDGDTGAIDALPWTKAQKEIVLDLIYNASISYPDWDTNHRWPGSSLETEVAYWRKANAVHAWFVDRVQGGEDDCRMHDEVTEDVLLELRAACRQIIESAVQVNGQVVNGYQYNKATDRMEPVLESGKRVLNPEVCEQLLPTQGGFFFGGTDYDEYYIADIEETFEQCTKLLEETDFENEILFYVSSW